MDFIRNKVHELYWEKDVNCARTMLICLSGLFGTGLEPQTLSAAIGLHGAGGYRAQCGLAEGALMFMGIHLSHIGVSESQVVSACYDFADAFTKEFGSLRCFDLRQGGFTPNDPPHMCEELTCKAVEFSYHFINQENNKSELQYESR